MTGAAVVVPLGFRACVQEHAEGLGIDRIGFTGPGPGAERERLEQWLAAGHHAEMRWLAKDPARRTDARKVLGGVRSILLAAVSYDHEGPRTKERQSPARSAWIARYAWGEDYHLWLKKRLIELWEFMRAELGQPAAEARVYVDTGPVLEKALAERAGLGWVGKNACLISPGLGSFVFLGAILLPFEVPEDEPAIDRCGTCTACLEVCPTDAFAQPYVVDARRCISYLTIEHRGPLDPQLESAMGEHVFGCDLCQDVCPYNRRSPRLADGLPHGAGRRADLIAPDLGELATMDVEAYRERFRKTPVKRRQILGLAAELGGCLGELETPERRSFARRSGRRPRARGEPDGQTGARSAVGWWSAPSR